MHWTPVRWTPVAVHECVRTADVDADELPVAGTFEPCGSAPSRPEAAAAGGGSGCNCSCRRRRGPLLRLLHRTPTLATASRVWHHREDMATHLRLLARCSVVVVPLCVVPLLFCSAAAAQATWQLVPTMPSRFLHAAAYDAAAHRIVVFGGFGPDAFWLDDTWEWDGARWSRSTTSPHPVLRQGHAMCHDAARRRTLLFGGLNGGTPLSDTWEWDGSAWIQLAPSRTPSARTAHSLAYDSARGRIVLFGGTSGSNDTWEWDGSTWTSVATSGPSARASAALAYDPRRGRAVLFGGVGLTSSLDDTWEWDGTTWTQRYPATRPPARFGHAMVFDQSSGTMLMFGGERNAVSASDTWSWDGTTWRQLDAGSPALARQHFMLVHDDLRRRVVLCGGRDATQRRAHGDLWEWTGSGWQQVAPSLHPHSASVALAFDEVRQLIIAYSGLDGATWQWNGATWQPVSTGASPGRQVRPLLVSDRVRKRIVLCASEGSNVTWEWDGNNWSRPAPLHRPPVLGYAAAAYDHARGRVVLFGCPSAAPQAPATWLWDGTDWVDAAPAASPPGRFRHALAYDERRARIVAFGGAAPPSLYLDETWEWDGAAWSQRHPSSRPPPHVDHEMTYDAARERVVLTGSASSNGGTWEWDGSEWSLRVAGWRAIGHALAYDRARQRIVQYGSSRAVPFETWEYASSTPARHLSFGTACAGSAGSPRLEAMNLPWLGGEWRLRLAPLPPAGPTALLLGASRSSWRGLPLPLPLDTLGMAGCTLFVAADLAMPLANVAGSAAVVVPIPDLPALAGQALFEQGLIADPGANPRGAVVSGAGASVLGVR